MYALTAMALLPSVRGLAAADVRRSTGAVPDRTDRPPQIPCQLLALKPAPCHHISCQLLVVKPALGTEFAANCWR
jgi:hypothetical protein